MGGVKGVGKRAPGHPVALAHLCSTWIAAIRPAVARFSNGLPSSACEDSMLKPLVFMVRNSYAHLLAILLLEPLADELEDSSRWAVAA